MYINFSGPPWASCGGGSLLLFLTYSILETPEIMIKDISKVSMPLELFYQKFEVIQHEYRKGIKEAVKNTEVEKEQKAFHLSHFFFFF